MKRLILENYQTNLYFENNKTLCLKKKVQPNDISFLKKEIDIMSKKLKQLEDNLFSARDNNQRKISIEKKVQLIKNKYADDMNFDSDFKKDLQEIKQYYTTQLSLQNKRDELNNSGFSSSYYYLEKDIAKQEEKMDLKNSNKEKETEKEKSVSTSEEFQKAMNMQMKYIFPVMIGYFSYTLPTGMSLYWNAFSLFSIIVHLVDERKKKKLEGTV